MPSTRSSYTITITTLSGGLFAPVTTLIPVLVSAGNGAKYFGTHISGGTYDFKDTSLSAAPDDGKYKLYESDGGTEIAKWGGANGRWIGDDILEAYEQSGTCVKLAGGNTISGNNAFVSACPKSYVAPTSTDHLTRKDYVDTAIANAIASGISLTAENTWTARNTFNKAISISGESSDYNRIYNTTIFTGSLHSTLTPVSGNNVTNKSYVDSAVNSIMAQYSGAAYQESPNIKRLIPNGSATGTVFTTWATALASCTADAGVNKQYTILISGEGTSSSYVEMGLISNNTKYVSDYIHWKGLGADITVLGGGNFSTDFQAGAVGRIVMEDINFYFDDDGQSSTITNIVFKNCKFQNNGGTTIFTNCRFEGANYFSQSYSVGDFSFANCTGERIFSALELTSAQITGTNRLQFYTPSRMTIGTSQIINNKTNIEFDLPLSVPNNLLLTNFNNTAPDYIASGPPSEKYGIIDDRMLTTPDKWLDVTIDGNVYAIPCYTPKGF